MKKETYNNFFSTVKFKISFLFVILFMLSALILYGVTYYFLKKNIMKQRYEELKGLVEELENIYIHASLPYENGSKKETQKRNPDRIKSIEQEFINETRYEGVARLYFALYSPNGKILAKSDLSGWNGLNLKIPKLSKEKVIFYFRAITAKNSNVIVIDKRLNDGNILEAGINLAPDERFLELYTSIFWIITFCMLVLSSVCAWLIAAKAMKGVTRVTQIAEEIGKGDISLRVPTVNEGLEIENLVQGFNNMLSKIEALIRELKEVSDNIAHDLRTPLTRIRGIIETTMNSNPSLNEYKEMTGDIIEECDRLIEIINTMLEITKIDSGVEKLSIDKVNITQILMNAYELFLPLAENKNIEFSLNLPEKEIYINADKSRFQRVIANLIDNAVKYTPPGGKIALSAKTDRTNLTISVRDSGCGLTQEEIARIFERFYRSDTSRGVDGNGLGLSLAKAIITAHNGVIRVESTPGVGSVFSVFVPMLPTSASSQN